MDTIVNVFPIGDIHNQNNNLNMIYDIRLIPMSDFLYMHNQFQKS